jgi:hypothetical protein
MPARSKPPTVPVLSNEVADVIAQIERFYTDVAVSLHSSGITPARPYLAVRLDITGPRFVGLPPQDISYCRWTHGGGQFFAAELFRALHLALRRTEERLAVVV